ncbi:MAG: hypothetical protein JXQ90_21725 [Cyclobacteriaceae bacterium]
MDPRTGEIKSRTSTGKAYTPREEIEDTIGLTLFESGSCIAKGSFHKLKNNGAHNYDDFSEWEAKNQVITYLDSIGVDPADVTIPRLEYGLNIQLPFCPNKLIDNVFLHQTERFDHEGTWTEGRYHQARHGEYYRFKIYNKSLQFKKYNVPQNLLRIELNCSGNYLRRNHGFKTCMELIEYDWRFFVKDLIAKWEQVLFYDWRLNGNSPRLDKYKNRNYWLELVEDGRMPAFEKHRRKLRTMIKDSYECQLFSVRDQLKSKGEELSMGGMEFQDILKMENSIPCRNPKQCKVTGLGISMQRCDSEVISHTGINYYRTTNYNIYKELERKYLTPNWKDDDQLTKTREIAHVIRGRLTTRKRNIIPNQLALFNPTPVHSPAV